MPCARRLRTLPTWSRAGWQVVVTHGNGPQVGFILRRNELAAHEVHPTPLDLIVADTQGSIGFMLQQTLNNEFLPAPDRSPVHHRRSRRRVSKADDPAFKNPTKPIGSFMDESQRARV